MLTAHFCWFIPPLPLAHSLLRVLLPLVFFSHSSFSPLFNPLVTVLRLWCRPVSWPCGWSGWCRWVARYLRREEAGEGNTAFFNLYYHIKTLSFWGGECNSMVMFISSDVNRSGELPGEQRWPCDNPDSVMWIRKWFQSSEAPFFWMFFASYRQTEDRMWVWLFVLGALRKKRLLLRVQFGAFSTIFFFFCFDFPFRLYTFVF